MQDTEADLSWQDIEDALQAGASLEAFLPAACLPAAAPPKAAPAAVLGEEAAAGQGPQQVIPEPTEELPDDAPHATLASEEDPSRQEAVGLLRHALCSDQLLTSQLVAAAQKLSILDWAQVFAPPAGLATVDHMPLVPRCQLPPVVLCLSLLASVQTPALAAFMLCNALPVLCVQQAEQQCEPRQSEERLDEGRQELLALVGFCTRISGMLELNLADARALLSALNLPMHSQPGKLVHEEACLRYFAATGKVIS